MRYYQITVKLPNGNTQTFWVQATSEEEARQRGRQFGTNDVQDSGAAIVTVGTVQDNLPDDSTVFNTQGQNIGKARIDDNLMNDDSLGLRKNFIEEFLPDFTQAFTQGRQAVGRALPNIDIGTGFGRSAANLLANPLVTTRNIQTAMDLAPAPLELTGNPFQQAAQTFQNLISAAPADRAQNEFLSELQSPQLGQGTGVTQNPFAREAADLARAAARNRFGAIFANRFLPRTENILQQFEESPGFGTDASFLPFLQQRFGLQ
jgi:hypothetical protein